MSTYLLDALDRNGDPVECSTKASNYDDALWLFYHDPRMMGVYPRWYTLRQKGKPKPRKPRGYIQLLPPRKETK